MRYALRMTSEPCAVEAPSRSTGGRISSSCSSGFGSTQPGMWWRTNSDRMPKRRRGKASSRLRGMPSDELSLDPLPESSARRGERLRLGNRRRPGHFRGPPEEVHIGTVSLFTGKLRSACSAWVSGGSRSDRAMSSTKPSSGPSNLVLAQDPWEVSSRGQAVAPVLADLGRIYPYDVAGELEQLTESIVIDRYRLVRAEVLLSVHQWEQFNSHRQGGSRCLRPRPCP